MDGFWYDIFIDVFRDGGMGIIMGIIMWLLGLVLVGGLLWGAFYLADTAGQAEQRTIGTVDSKEFVRQHLSTTYVMSGQAMVPITQNIPDKWYLGLTSEKGEGTLEVAEIIFERVKEGEQVEIQFKSGRITQGFYPLAVYGNFQEEK